MLLKLSSNLFLWTKKGIFWFWILNGIIISLLITGMYATGSRSLTDSLKFGDVCDAPIRLMRFTTDADNTENYYLEGKRLRIDLQNKDEDWNYLYVYLDASSDMVWNLTFCNQKDKEVFEYSVEVGKGINKLELGKGDFSYFWIDIVSPDKCDFTIKNIQVREKEKIDLETKHIICFAVSLIAYLIIVAIMAIVTKRKKVNFYKVIQVIQNIYIVVGDSLSWLPKKIDFKTKHKIRIGLLIFWQVFVMFMSNMRIYTSLIYYKYLLLIASGIVFAIAILLLEKPLCQVSWKRPIIFYWFFLSIVMCVSEYMIPKRHMLMGVIYITIFGFLYFVWNNAKESDVFLGELMSSLKGTFVIFSVFSICFRPMIDENIYSGPAWNPNAFAAHLLPVILSLLTEIQLLIVAKKKRLMIYIDIILLLMAIVFVYLTQSRIAILFTCGLIMLFLLHLWCHIMPGKRFLKVLFCSLVVGVLLIPTYMTVTWAVKHIPPMIGKEVEFSQDIYKTEENPMSKVKAAEEESVIESIIYAPVVSDTLTMRNLYWLGYIREWNIVGHEDAVELWASKKYAHNGMLAIVHRYGILSAAPYMFLFLSALYWSFFGLKHAKTKTKKGYTFFVFGMCIITIAYSLVENIEWPFYLTEWIVFYFMLGVLFDNSFDVHCANHMDDK